MLQSGDPQQAFELLKLCENDPDASPDALILLASFYEDDEFNGDDEKRARLTKAWELFERAALMGDEDAILTLATMYAVGSEGLGFGPELNVADCLLDVV